MLRISRTADDAVELTCRVHLLRPWAFTAPVTPHDVDSPQGRARSLLLAGNREDVRGRPPVAPARSKRGWYLLASHISLLLTRN